MQLRAVACNGPDAGRGYDAGFRFLCRLRIVDQQVRIRSLSMPSRPTPSGRPTRPRFPEPWCSRILRRPITTLPSTPASVAALTGVSGSSTNVSLTLGLTDGNGDFTGTFDQNNAGTIISVNQPPPPASCATGTVCIFSYTYTAGSSTNGRYTFQMLGNPNASPVVSPLTFVLYASGANRGFLLDQSSSSVMTGTMASQGNIGLGLSSSEVPGTFAAATTVSSSPTLSPIAANLFATWAEPTGSPCTATCLTGTQYPGLQTMTGTYTISTSGTGSIALTAPSTETYVIYAVNTIGCKSTAKNANPVCAVQSFYMMGSCTIPSGQSSCSTLTFRG
jgi:hypothetical protein